MADLAAVRARRTVPCVRLLFAVTMLGLGCPSAYSQTGAGQLPKDDPRYESVADALVRQREAEARMAIAEAERAELLARLPPSSAKPLAGELDTRQFGAAGLVKAFDLAAALAKQVCATLPADRTVVIYEAGAAQAVVAARTVNDGIARLTDDLRQQNKQLQVFIDTHTPPGSRVSSLSLVTLAIVPATVKAVADMTALFKSDLRAAGIDYGEGARSLFATSLASSCPDRIIGLGAGYLGELDVGQHDRLLSRVRSLSGQRGDYANRIAIVEKLAATAKGEQKRELTAVANAASARLKTVDAFIDSLRAGEASEKSPLFNAARYLGYASRTEGALVLDFGLQLEGMTLVKDNLFTGQHLRLSGVALLWYRLHDPNGTLLLARTMRRITEPIAVNLRGNAADSGFWDPPPRSESARQPPG